MGNQTETGKGKSGNTIAPDPEVSPPGNTSAPGPEVSHPKVFNPTIQLVDDLNLVATIARNLPSFWTLDVKSAAPVSTAPDDSAQGQWAGNTILVELTRDEAFGGQSQAEEDRKKLIELERKIELEGIGIKIEVEIPPKKAFLSSLNSTDPVSEIGSVSPIHSAPSAQSEIASQSGSIGSTPLRSTIIQRKSRSKDKESDKEKSRIKEQSPRSKDKKEDRDYKPSGGGRKLGESLSTPDVPAYSLRKSTRSGSAAAKSLEAQLVTAPRSPDTIMETADSQFMSVTAQKRVKTEVDNENAEAQKGKKRQKSESGQKKWTPREQSPALAGEPAAFGHGKQLVSSDSSTDSEILNRPDPFDVAFEPPPAGYVARVRSETPNTSKPICFPPNATPQPAPSIALPALAPSISSLPAATLVPPPVSAALSLRVNIAQSEASLSIPLNPKPVRAAVSLSSHGPAEVNPAVPQVQEAPQMYPVVPTSDTSSSAMRPPNAFSTSVLPSTVPVPPSALVPGAPLVGAVPVLFPINGSPQLVYIMPTGPPVATEYPAVGNVVTQVIPQATEKPSVEPVSQELAADDADKFLSSILSPTGIVTSSMSDNDGVEEGEVREGDFLEPESPTFMRGASESRNQEDFTWDGANPASQDRSIAQLKTHSEDQNNLPLSGIKVGGSNGLEAAVERRRAAYIYNTGLPLSTSPSSVRELVTRFLTVGLQVPSRDFVDAYLRVRDARDPAYMLGNTVVVVVFHHAVDRDTAVAHGYYARNTAEFREFVVEEATALDSPSVSAALPYVSRKDLHWTVSDEDVDRKRRRSSEREYDWQQRGPATHERDRRAVNEDVHPGRRSLQTFGDTKRDPDLHNHGDYRRELSRYDDRVPHDAARTTRRDYGDERTSRNPSPSRLRHDRDRPFVDRLDDDRLRERDHFHYDRITGDRLRDRHRVYLERLEEERLRDRGYASFDRFSDRDYDYDRKRSSYGDLDDRDRYLDSDRERAIAHDRFLERDRERILISRDGYYDLKRERDSSVDRAIRARARELELKHREIELTRERERLVLERDVLERVVLGRARGREVVERERHRDVLELERDRDRRREDSRAAYYRDPSRYSHSR
ncbi:hypothetical protein HDU93_000145 [Gonapodya sp. JEL0774]|nr:hypothetical protein HDU93_000145 [Gonapodya sp. JEL0774]